MASVCHCGSMKTFIQKRRLPKTIPMSILKEVLEKTKLTQPEILPIYSNFRSLAPYGVMTFSKFKGTMGILGMLDDLFLSLSMFHAFDKDNNGELTFVEFATALSVMVRGSDSEKLELAFRIICPKFRDTTQHLGYTYQAELEPKQKKKIAVDTIISQAPVISFSQFLFVVTSLERTRRELVGAEQTMLVQEHISEVFRDVAKTKTSDGSFVISLADFKQAVRTNPEFLVLLGVFPGTIDNQVSFNLRIGSSPFQIPTPDMSPYDYKFMKEKHIESDRVSKYSTESPFKVYSTSNLQKSMKPVSFEKLKNHSVTEKPKSQRPSNVSNDGSEYNKKKSFFDAVKIQGSHGQNAPVSYPSKEFIFCAKTNSVASSPSVSSESLITKPMVQSPQPMPVAIEKHELTNLKLHLTKLLQDMQEKYNEIPRCMTQSIAPSMSYDVRKPSDCFPETMLSAQPEQPESTSSSPSLYIRTINTLASLKLHAETPPSFRNRKASDEKSFGKLSNITILSQLAPRADISFPNQTNIESPLPTSQSHVSRSPIINDTNKLISCYDSNWRYIEAKIEELILRLDLRLYSLEKHPKHDFFFDAKSAASKKFKDFETIQSFRKSYILTDFCKDSAQLMPASQVSISRQPFIQQMTTSRRMYMNRPNFDQYRRQRRHGSIATLQERIQRRRVEYKLLGPYKGFSVHFGHPSWNTVLVMMVGIRLAAGSSGNESPRSVIASDFSAKKKIDVMPRSTLTAEYSSQRAFLDTVWFVDYAPLVFRNIRELFGITAESYLHSIGPEQLIGNMVLGNLASLSELCTEGKSGSFFYYTADGRFLIKTITRASAKFFESILKDYYDHLFEYPNTLIARFYGYHAMKLKRPGHSRIKLYFVIMGNVFHTPVEIHRRYDLKGSWVGRTSGTAAKADPTIAMKDADLVAQGEKIVVGSEQREILIRLIELDAEFFKKHLILDYSLLVGIHYVNYFSEDDISIPNERQNSKMGSTTEIDYLQQRGEILGNLPPYPARERDIEGIISVDKQKTYYFGIIDILTRWTVFKRIENVAKSIQYKKAEGISCIHPTIYANRFVQFLRQQIE